jgi:hypothetical protein
MPQIRVKTPFKFAHHGHQVEEFAAADEPRETSAEVAAVAVAEGWAELVQTPAPSASERAVPRSPEDKDAAKQRKTKTLKD